MKRILEYLLWLIYPKRCAICGKVIERKDNLCQECDKNLERIEKSCNICGAPIKACECKRNVYRFRGCVAPFYKGENSMKMIYRFKLHGKLDSADFLADSIYAKIKECFSDQKFDVVTAVPMSTLKHISRGYNHSEKIARSVARKAGLDYKRLLVKNTFGKPQHTLPRDERFENVKGMFKSACKTNYKKVLLIDDVKTTGATLNECTRELLFSGSDEVYCAVAVANAFGIEK